MKIQTVLILLLVISAESVGQLCPKKINRFGEDGLKTGKWITYWDDDKKIPMSKAKFEHGRETGVSKEYHQNGQIRMKFRHYKNRIRVKYYNKDGQLEQKGWARMDYSENDVHFYWHGKWKFFDDNRKMIKVSYYENGEEVVTAIR